MWEGVGEPLGFAWSPPCSCSRLNQGRGLVVGDSRRQWGGGSVGVAVSGRVRNPSPAPTGDSQFPCIHHYGVLDVWLGKLKGWEESEGG